MCPLFGAPCVLSPVTLTAPLIITGTPYDPTPSPVATSPLSQVTYLQWNYRDVYVPPPLLCQLLSEATTLDRQTEVWKTSGILISVAVCWVQTNPPSCSLSYAKLPKPPLNNRVFCAHCVRAALARKLSVHQPMLPFQCACLGQAFG